MEINALIEQDREHHLHANTNPVDFAQQGPVLIERANGVRIQTSDGLELIDARSGAWCVNVGYGNERICRAAYDAMRQLSYSLSFAGRTNPWAAALSEKMAAITPPQFQRFFFGSTGSDAVETALKLVLYYWNLRGKPEKRKIIARELAYHGNTLVAAHLVGQPNYGTQYGFPLVDLFHHVRPPYHYRHGRDQSAEAFGLEAARDIEREILKIGPDQVAAVIGEPIQASLGLIIPPDSYWPEVRRICDKYDVLLISDEVVTGMGKTGNMFAFETFGFEPDIFTLAKGFSSGYFPMSCVGVGAEVDRILQAHDRPFVHGYTYCAHPVGAAVALENIAVIEDEALVEKVRTRTAPHLEQSLSAFRDFPFVGEIGVRGIMAGIELDIGRVRESSREESEALGVLIGEIAWAKGLSARTLGTTFALIFPMIISESEVNEALSILRQAFEEAWAAFTT
jgi:putrescine aminotransferase